MKKRSWWSLLSQQLAEGHQGQGIGHQLVDAMKRKKRLSLHVYEKNNGAVAFYKKEGFYIENYLTEKETGENEYLMVYNAANSGSSVKNIHNIVL